MKLSLINIRKKYKKKEILKGIDLNFESGKIYGIVGPNGVGKSTMIKIIAGLISQYNGDLRCCDGEKEINILDFRKEAGFIIENPQFDLSMSGADNIKICATLYGNEKSVDYSDILKLVGLDDTRLAVRKYSLGMKQRLGLACLLVSNPKAVFLDEPTNGLDPMGIRDLRNMITKMAHEEDRMVIVTSHMLSELQKICDEYYFIKDGKVVKHISEEMEGNELEELYLNIMENGKNEKID